MGLVLKSCTVLYSVQYSLFTVKTKKDKESKTSVKLNLAYSQAALKNSKAGLR